MPSHRLVTFGGAPGPWHYKPEIIRDYAAEAARLLESAVPFSLGTRGYDDAWLRANQFCEDHRDVTDLPHFGWLFKPYVISRALEAMPDGGYIIWADSNMLAKADPQPLFDVCDKVGAFIQGHKGILPNAHWTRREVFALMGCDKPKYWDAPQCKASLIAFKASETIRLFVSDWLRYCCDIRIIDNSRPGDNLPGFKAGRGEQSVLSILRQRYGIPLQPQSKIFVKVDP